MSFFLVVWKVWTTSIGSTLNDFIVAFILSSNSQEVYSTFVSLHFPLSLFYLMQLRITSLRRRADLSIMYCCTQSSVWKPAFCLPARIGAKDEKFFIPPTDDQTEKTWKSEDSCSLLLHRFRMYCTLRYRKSWVVGKEMKGKWWRKGRERPTLVYSGYCNNLRPMMRNGRDSHPPLLSHFSRRRSQTSECGIRYSENRSRFTRNTVLLYFTYMMN